MEIALIIICLLFILLSVYFFAIKNKTRSSNLKKGELIQKYENEMKKIVKHNKNNSEVLAKKKIEYLKKASHELHNNIFFDEAEAKALIKRLASF